MTFEYLKVSPRQIYKSYIEEFFPDLIFSFGSV